MSPLLDKILQGFPFLDFELNLRAFKPKLWLMLGECQSKCEHLAAIPLRPDVAREMHEVLLTKGALATTAIEGNTLSEEEMDKFDQGKPVPPSQQYLVDEVNNIRKRANGLCQIIISGEEIPMDSKTLSEHNIAILKGLPGSEREQPGVVRSAPVVVGRYRPPAEHEALVALTERMCEWIRTDFPHDLLGEGYPFASAIVQSIMSHLYIAWIHPFLNGNGRTARLVELQLLLNGGLPSPAVHLLSNHYNKTRTEYYRHLDIAKTGQDGIAKFIEYAVEGMRDALREQIISVKKQQIQVTWQRLVSEMFNHQTDSESTRRKEMLVIALARHERPVPKSELTEMSVPIYKKYASRNVRTIDGDLKELEEAQLILKDEDGYRANLSLVQPFLPIRRKGMSHLEEMKIMSSMG